MFIIIDQNIELSSKLMKWIERAKQIKKIPVFFLTDSPKSVIKLYSKILYGYGEMDDFFDVTEELKFKENFSKKIDNLFNLKKTRAARRVQLNFPAFVSTMTPTSEKISVTINDLSLFGVGLSLTNPEENFFSYNQNLLITFQSNFTKNTAHLSEFFKGLIRIKRRSLNPKSIGCTWWMLNKPQELFLQSLIQNQLILAAKKKSEDLTSKVPVVFEQDVN
jgi:hypothetical protein